MRQLSAGARRDPEGPGHDQGHGRRARPAPLFEDPKYHYPNTDAGKAKLIDDLNARSGHRSQAACRSVRHAAQGAARDPARARRPSRPARRAATTTSARSMARGRASTTSTCATPPRTRRWTLPTLTYHEGIPGHHLQVTLQQEADLPMIRAGRLASRPMPRAGRSIPSSWPTRWASTRTTRSAGSAICRPPCSAPRAWWSTPACTPSAGAASRRSSTSSTRIGDAGSGADHRDRALLRLAGPGLQLHGRQAELAAAARDRPRAALGRGSTSAPSTTRPALGAVPLTVLEAVIDRYIAAAKG